MFNHDGLPSNVHLQEAQRHLVAHEMVEEVAEYEDIMDDMTSEIMEQLCQREVDAVPYYHIIAANVRAGLPPNSELNDPEDACLEFEGAAATLIYGRAGGTWSW